MIARQVAKAIGTDHHELLLTERQFANQLEAALESLDQPTFDGLNSYYMSRAVRDAGLKVALVGTGGDELFGGYTSFRQLPALQHLGRIPKRLRALAAKGASSMLRRPNGQISPQTRWAKLPEILNRQHDPLTLYQTAYALFLPDFQRQLLGSETVELLIDGLPPTMRARIADEVRRRAVMSAISVLEQRLFLGERLLRDTDAASMSASIEVRLPLVDRVLVEYVARLPVTQRFKPVGKKAMLRRTGLRGLNPELFNRPKSGFVLPYEQWLKSGLREAVDATMRDTSAVTQTGLNAKSVERLWAAFIGGAPGLYWSRVWAVYVLIRWCQRHGAVL
jgi:asparagine synthase (glutamine-hydrolysing)